jgi:hypothetical protein
MLVMAKEPADVATEYFSRMRAGDISVVDLFHDDATLIGLGTKRTGRDEINAFYEDVIERAGPSPQFVGPLLADGSRVAAEIEITFPNGMRVYAVDVFKVENARIQSLTYYICSTSE